MSKLIVVVDGLALFVWRSNSLDIHIPYMKDMHQPQVLGPDQKWINLAQTKFQILPDPRQTITGPSLGPNQLVLNPDVVHAGPGSNVTTILGLARPALVLGTKRFSVPTGELLDGTDPSILKYTPQKRTMLCVRAHLVYENISKAGLVGDNQTFPAIQLRNGNLQIVLLSHQIMGMEHRELLNDMLWLKTGGNPNLNTATIKDIVWETDDDVSGLGLEIPEQVEVEVEGTGCGGANDGD